MKVSEKGAVSIYGMGRFPVTLYKEQWLKLLDMSDDIRAFTAANEAQLNSMDCERSTNIITSESQEILVRIPLSEILCLRRLGSLSILVRTRT